VTREKLRRKRLQRGVEPVAQIGLHALARPEDREARAQARGAVGGGEDEDQADVAAERGAGAVAAERVDRVLDRPRDGEREAGGREQTEGAERVTLAVPPDGEGDGVRGRRQPRLPAACGLSAA
jgi:hypothetical protein